MRKVSRTASKALPLPMSERTPNFTSCVGIRIVSDTSTPYLAKASPSIPIIASVKLLLVAFSMQLIAIARGASATR